MMDECLRMGVEDQITATWDEIPWLRIVIWEWVDRGERYTVKKGYRFSRPQPGCHLPNSLWAEIINIPDQRELVK